MKRYAASAQEIVRRIVEGIDDDDLGLGDVSELNADFWDQFDGDFGNPWVWGGSWYNAKKNEIIHFEGIDSLPQKYQDVDPDTVVVPEDVMDRIKAKVHDPYLDTEEAKEDPDWHHRMTFSEEMEIDQIADRYKLTKAEILSSRILRPVYLIHVDYAKRLIHDYWDIVSKQIERDMGFNSSTADWPDHSKIMEIIRYRGNLDEVGERLNMTYSQLQAKLGTGENGKQNI